MTEKRRFLKIFGLILVAALLFAVLPAGQVKAATLDVCSTCAYTTIQAAIDAASEGDTINVSLGTYNENLTVNKSVTLLGAGRDVTTIQGVAPTHDSGMFNITASNVTVDGFEIVGVGNKTVRITQAVDNVQFLNNKVVGGDNTTLANGWSVFESNYNMNQTNLVVDDNIFIGNDSSQLFYLNPQLINLTFTNNTFEGTVKPSGLVAGFDGLDGAQVITGNTFNIDSDYALLEAFGTYDIVDIFDANTWPEGYIATGNKVAPVSVVYPSTNDINRSNDWAHVNKVSADVNEGTITLDFVQARGFYSCFEYRTDGDTSQITGDPQWNPEILDGLYSYYCLNTPSTRTETFSVSDYIEVRLSSGAEKDERFFWTKFEIVEELWVCETGDCGHPGESFNSIQDAIDASDIGTTIHVMPGTYAEQLELRTPDITVQSTDGADVTILDVPDGHLTTGVMVLANMGTVTFDGFTVKDFTENGIVQGMSAHEGTTFHVLNNKIIPAADYLRNGIQVTGDGSTVIGNYIEGAYLTEDWASTAIGVVNASNVLVQDNEISGAVNGIDGGISVYTWGDVSVSGNQVINNIIYNADYPLTVEAYDGGTTSDVNIHQNKVTNYEVPLLVEPYPDDEYGIPGVAVENVDASHNWWGSKYGPQSPIEGEATIIKWCADEACTEFLPDDDNVIEISGGIAVAGGIQIVPGVTLLLKDGTVIENNSPCIVINADNTKITTESLGGATCVPTSGSNGIDVADGLTNIIIEGLEIDGSGQDTGDGIHFAGAITDVILRDNFIHDLDGDGVAFVAVPAGVVQIQGNLFMDNAGYGVNAPEDLDVTYNAWGGYAGAASGDGLPAVITSSDPWTHVDLYMESSGTDVTDEVREGETITYTIYANLQNATGADFKIVFDASQLEVASTMLGSVFTAPATGLEVLTFDNGTGEIHFAGVPEPFEAKSGEDLMLFSVTFTAKADGESDLSFSDDSFAMSPAGGPSNNIYAAGLEDGGVTVRNHYTVTGTVSMQGRTERSGILVTLTSNVLGIEWGPFQATSTAPISSNVSLANVVENHQYQLTISQDRYLDVTVASGKLVDVDTDLGLNAIELLGGDVNDSNAIGVDDASIVGTDYGSSGTENEGDANFDGMVNIQDLALVGGNYGLTSATAYGGWTP